MARMCASISSCGRSQLMWPSSLLQFFGQRRLRLVLLEARGVAGLDQRDGLQQRVGADLGQAIVQALGGFVPAQRDRFLEQDVAGVEALVHPHDRDARLLFARGDGGMDRRGARDISAAARRGYSGSRTCGRLRISLVRIWP